MEPLGSLHTAKTSDAETRMTDPSLDSLSLMDRSQGPPALNLKPQIELFICRIQIWTYTLSKYQYLAKPPKQV